MPGNRPHHTDKWRSCVEKVMKQGHDESSTSAICTTSLQDSGQEIFVAEAARHFHLRGALGAAQTTSWKGKEHLVVPCVALMEGVIHAVNASSPEYVPFEALSKSVDKWNGHPLVVGHPVRDGKQISAYDPKVLDKHCGFIRNAHVNGKRLGFEVLVDPERLTTLKHDQLLADLRAGKEIEVSVGAFVSTNDKKDTHNGKAYDGQWVDIFPDHFALLPGGRGACSLEMGCGAHRAASCVVTAEDFKALSNPEGINQYSHGGASATHEKAANAHREAIKQLKKDPSKAQSISDTARVATEKATTASSTARQDGVLSNDVVQAQAHASIAEGRSRNGDVSGAIKSHENAVAAHESAVSAHKGERVKELHDEQKRMLDIQLKNSGTIHSMNAAAREKEIIHELRSIRQTNPEHFKPRTLKPRSAAGLFDTPSQAASEEAAELIAYNSMRTLLDSVGDHWDEASGLLDELIADEEENPTESAQEEEAEEELETAKLEAIRMLCYTMASTLQNIVSVTYSQTTDIPDVNGPRYMEALRTAIGKKISAANMKIVQAAHNASHDTHAQTVALGAQCDAEMKGLAKVKTTDCTACKGTGSKDGNPCEACDGSGQVPAVKVAESIRHEGGKWLLYSKNSSRVLGIHGTKEEAELQEQAIAKSLARQKVG